MWARARFTQLQPWHTLWLPDQLKGGAPGREAMDAYFLVALESEFCSHSNHSLVGILYDYTKCFDNVAWQIERGLLRDLGMPNCVLGQH